jgi:hypothetical protein
MDSYFCPCNIAGVLISLKTVNASAKLLKFVLSVALHIRNHEYFYQIQGQLFCTGATSCNFVIYTFKDFKCIHVKREEWYCFCMYHLISHNKRTFNFKDSFTIYDSIWGCPNKWVTFTDKNATLSGSMTMFRTRTWQVQWIHIKCPFVVRNQMIHTKTVPFLKEEDGHIFLDNNHDYFYQIQGQLFCTGATSCNFVIYTFTDFKCIHVKREILKEPLNVTETKLGSEITFVCFMLCNFKPCIIPETA